MAALHLSEETIKAVLSIGEKDRLDSEGEVGLEMRERVVELLKKYKIPFLEAIPPEKYGAIASACRMNKFSEGEVIFEEGDQGDAFYVIVFGQVEVSSGNTVFSMLGEGRFFGEVSLVLDTPRTATCKATKSSVMLTMSKENFKAIFQDFPDVLAEIELKIASTKCQIRSIVYHPKGIQYFTEYLKSQYAEESIEFWKAVRDFRKWALGLSDKAEDIKKTRVEAEKLIDTFIKEGAPRQVNISSRMANHIITEVKQDQISSQTFYAAEREVVDLMSHKLGSFKQTESFGKFLGELGGEYTVSTAVKNKGSKQRGGSHHELPNLNFSKENGTNSFRLCGPKRALSWANTRRSRNQSRFSAFVFSGLSKESTAESVIEEPNLVSMFTPQAGSIVENGEKGAKMLRSASSGATIRTPKIRNGKFFAADYTRRIVRDISTPALNRSQASCATDWVASSVTSSVESRNASTDLTSEFNHRRTPSIPHITKTRGMSYNAGLYDVVILTGAKAIFDDKNLLALIEGSFHHHHVILAYAVEFRRAERMKRREEKRKGEDPDNSKSLVAITITYKSTPVGMAFAVDNNHLYLSRHQPMHRGTAILMMVSAIVQFRGTADGLEGVHGPLDEVNVFKNCWVLCSGAIAFPGSYMKSMCLDQLRTDPEEEESPRGETGKLIVATKEHAAIVQHLFFSFMEEILHTNAHSNQKKAKSYAKHYMDQRSVFLWVNADSKSKPKVYSMVCIRAEGEDFVRLDYLFTPSEYRRRGYGFKCAKELCTLLMTGELEWKRCFNGVKRIVVLVDEVSLTACKIFTKVGFVESNALVSSMKFGQKLRINT